MGSSEHRLADGRTVLLRAAGPADIPAIARLYAELSADSFHSRFQSGQPGPVILSRLAHLGPPPGTRCLVAAMPFEPGHLAGEIRYVSLGSGTAELGLTVLDSYQGAGLGRILLAALVEDARQAGLERLRAIVSLTNAPMLHLLTRYGWALAERTDGYSVACLEISAIGGMPGWPAEYAGRRVLVERRGWFDNERVSALRDAGFDVRQCTGPRQQTGRTCPLLTAGQCRLAEEADLIVSMLPPDDPTCAAVVAAHRRLWPGRLAG